MTIALYCLLAICALTGLRPALMAWRSAKNKWLQLARLAEVR